GEAARGRRRTRSLPCQTRETRHRMMQPALHGTLRAADDLRHLVLAEVVIVAQDDDAPLRLGERGEETAGIERCVRRSGRPGPAPLATAVIRSSSVAIRGRAELYHTRGLPGTASPPRPFARSRGGASGGGGATRPWPRRCATQSCAAARPRSSGDGPAGANGTRSQRAP